MPLPFTPLYRAVRGNFFRQPGVKNRMLPLLLFLLTLLPLTAQTQTHDSSGAAQVTPEWVEGYLYRRNSVLLADSANDHVMSFYYFGRVGLRTLIGLERVRGDDYEQFFSLLIFNGAELLGYYHNVLSFPSGVSASGDVQFPRGVNAHLQDADAPLSVITMKFSALCQRQRGVQSLAEQCVPWTPVHSQ